MFVWVFHRVSGLILILLITFKIITGYGILGHFGTNISTLMREFHRSVAIDLLTVGLFIYHAFYGLRTCLIDMGLCQEKLLFWWFTILGALIFLWFIYWLLSVT